MEAGWIDELSASTGDRWPAIGHARTRTEELLDRLRNGLREFDDPNCSIVVTGSLGRGEASEASDADWMMIVDGQSNPDHAPIAHRIAQRIADLGFKKPGRTATFGDLVSSHELIHYIAGTHDSNANLTRRILLLCESRALTQPLVRERVIRNILARYVVHDPSIRTTRPPTMSLFLLNDVVRYWRTIASDYASKMWEREKEEWAIRNIKLRFSRKLLFVGGLLIAFAGELFSEQAAVEGLSPEEQRLRLAELIREQTNFTPLELLARVLVESGNMDTARLVFGAYDQFLGAMSDNTTREHLERLQFDAATADPKFESLLSTSRDFRRGINSLFFDEHSTLKRLIRDYGVF
jgi:Putative nucleotidyltransferase DUF294